MEAIQIFLLMILLVAPPIQTSFEFDTTKATKKEGFVTVPLNPDGSTGLNVTFCVNKKSSCESLILCIDRDHDKQRKFDVRAKNWEQHFETCGADVHKFSALKFAAKYVFNWLPWEDNQLLLNISSPTTIVAGDFNPMAELTIDLMAKTNEFGDSYCAYLTLANGENGRDIRKAYTGEKIANFQTNEELSFSFSTANPGRVINIKAYSKMCSMWIAVSAMKEFKCFLKNANKFVCPDPKITTDDDVSICQHKLPTRGIYYLKQDGDGFEDKVIHVPEFIREAISLKLKEEFNGQLLEMIENAEPPPNEMYLADIGIKGNPTTITLKQIWCTSGSGGLTFKYNTGVYLIKDKMITDGKYLFI